MKFILKIETPAELAKFIQETGIEIELPFIDEPVLINDIISHPIPMPEYSSVTTGGTEPAKIQPFPEHVYVNPAPKPDAKPKRTYVLDSKPCATCGEMFTPNHNRTASCDACRSKKAAKLHQATG